MSDVTKILTKAAVLAALYNAAKPQGMGFLHYHPTLMTEEEAATILVSGTTYFDYLRGRVMKIDLSHDVESLNTSLYNRDNGPGAAERAIAALRSSGNTNDPSVAAIQKQNTVAAAEDVSRSFGTKSEFTQENGMVVLTLGMDDMEEYLSPEIDKVLGNKK